MTCRRRLQTRNVRRFRPLDVRAELAARRLDVAAQRAPVRLVQRAAR
jgi:hypothetical protein